MRALICAQRQRDIRYIGTAEHPAIIAAKPAWQVNRQRSLCNVHMVRQRCGKRTIQWPIEPDTKQRIDQQRASYRLGIERFHPPRPAQSRIARQIACRWRTSRQADISTHFSQYLRGDIAIAAIIAGAAEDMDRPPSRQPPRHRRDRAARARHQLRQGHARRRFGSAHLRDG